MKAKTLTNTTLIETVSFIPREKSEAFKWIEYRCWLSFFGNEKSKKAGWAWRGTEGYLSEAYAKDREYRSDFDLIEAHPHLSIEDKVLYRKPHVNIRYASGKTETKWFPNDEMAELYWKRLIKDVPNLKDISEPKNYTDV